MPWNPDVYNKFKEDRYQPFYDLISHIKEKPSMTILDLGCGTGELTKILVQKFPGSTALGIDSSAEMLAQAPKHDQLSFAQRSIQDQLTVEKSWDLIVANASLQWVDAHEQLFPRIISKLAEGGQLAIQMPCQKENALNQLLLELVMEEPYYQVLKESVRYSPLLSLDNYTQLLFESNAEKMTIYQKVYPLLAESTTTLFEFISGSALVPYMEKLPAFLKDQFVADYKTRIEKHFRTSPILYAFKRIIIVAQF